MNLVSKEYVASRGDGSGVLLLSEMAGALEELSDAIPINPYDLEGVAETIWRAIQMPMDEREKRMTRMRDSVRRHDIYAWMETLLKSMIQTSD